jgi:hypothetical protein
MDRINEVAAILAEAHGRALADTAEEKRLLADVRKLSARRRNAVHRFANSLASLPEEPEDDQLQSHSHLQLVVNNPAVKP